MRAQKIFSIGNSSLVVLALTVSSASAAVNVLQQGITDYNHAQYAVGLKKFLIVEKQGPANSIAMAHYYAALCEQNLNQTSEAKAEYEWLLAYGNPMLKGYAQTGLENLGRRASSRVAASSTPAASSHAAAIAAATAAPASSLSNGGVRKVIEFTTGWCSVCKAVAPIVDESKSRLPSVQFENLDAEDPQNSSLVSKYDVKAYPTFVFSRPFRQHTFT